MSAVDQGPGPRDLSGLLSVDEAQARLLSLVHPLPEEEIALREASGRYLARSVRASRDQPPFDTSAMDGYAVIGDPEAGSILTVIGESGAGHAFTGTLSRGQAVRIFTGAPLPAAATRVVIQEDVTRIDTGQIRLKEDARGSTNIRLKGQDFSSDSTVSPRLLRPADLALLAAMNIPRLPLYRRPEVAIIATGDELVLPGEQPRADQIIASNGFALAAMVEEAGGRARILPVARDDLAALATVIGLARGADVVVTIGGASVGDHDLVAPALRAAGMQPAFWKVALRPGKPLMAGKLGDAIVLGLPGNPVSSIVCGHLFLKPLLRALQGDPAPLPRDLPARLAQPVAPNGPRAHYMRARHDPQSGLVTPFDRQDSALLREMAEATCLLIRPPRAPAEPAGAEVRILPLHG